MDIQAVIFFTDNTNFFMTSPKLEENSVENFTKPYTFNNFTYRLQNVM